MDRVKQLKTASIEGLVQSIFKEPVMVKDLGHNDEMRNYVMKINEILF